MTDIPETGIRRARAVLQHMENYAPTPGDTGSRLSAMAAHAQAIAVVEMAETAQVAMLIEFTRSPIFLALPKLESAKIIRMIADALGIALVEGGK